MARQKKRQSFEKRTARKHRGRHIGGPEKPDYTRGDIQGEVKQRQRPLTKPEVMEECRKGRDEIVCSGGFTESAIRYVRRYRPGVKLLGGR